MVNAFRSIGCFVLPLATHVCCRKSRCGRSSCWHRFLSSFLASKYGASPVARRTVRKRCIWFLGCLGGPIFGTAWRSQKWVRRLHLLSFLYNSLKTVPKTGPFAGPVFGTVFDEFLLRWSGSSLLHCNLATVCRSLD